MRDNHAAYRLASFQLTLMTGKAGSRPKPLEEAGGQPPTDTQASHSLNVTGYLETANGPSIVTRCCGLSSSWRPASPTPDPIVNAPAGITTISGQSLAHSRKTDCGFSALSTAAVST